MIYSVNYKVEVVQEVYVTQGESLADAIDEMPLPDGYVDGSFEIVEVVTDHGRVVKKAEYA